MAWIFTSHASLQEAGYTWRSSGVCEQCWQKILWYTNVDRKLVPINPGTFMIHFATCEKLRHRHTDPPPANVINIADRQRQMFCKAKAAVMIESTADAIDWLFEPDPPEPAA